VRVKFRFDGSLPSVDTELLVLTSSVTAITLRYVAASQKLGLTVASEAEVLSDATVSAGGFVSVDFRVIHTGATPSIVWTTNWQVDYGTGPVAQTDIIWAAGTVSLAAYTIRLGWATAITVPGVTFAYLLNSVTAGHYPLGEHTIVLLTPSGTPTVSGTVGNFAFITANATGSALTSGTLADVPATIGDFPPTVGGSADGVCAITAHASDYLEIPLATYDASGTGSIRAARVVIPMWAASGTAATCRVNGWDGTTSTALFAEADPEADNSSTPAWICKMWRPSGGWDQTKLDAAAIRFGSNDATPDIGPHAIGMEVCVQSAQTQTLFGALATQALDPVSAGVLGVDVTPTPGYDATLHYEQGGTPTDVAAPGGTTTTEVIDAPDAPSVEYLALYPPPEDISDA
jgi:hypothetical protein